MFAPTFPDAITGWDTVTTWTPGIWLFIREPLGIRMTISDQSSFAREVAASPDSYRGDGLEWSMREAAWFVFEHTLIFAGAIVMICCAFKKRFSRVLGYIASTVMGFGLIAFIKVYILESQTYVGGAFHIGVGAYLWVLSCVSLLIAIATNIEIGSP